MDASGKVIVLHSFGDPGTPVGGRIPQGTLVQGSDGSFYGTTSQSGVNDAGTALKMDAFGNIILLHSFGNSKTPNDGKSPAAGLILAKNGVFYGTTTSGGAHGYGTVFKMTAAGKVTTLYSFGGASPQAALIQGKDGNFYGTTANGGTNSYYGTVFKIDSKGNYTLLYSFGASNTDGRYPQAALIQAKDGSFYGTTVKGGANGYGTVFKMTVSSETAKVTILHSFDDGTTTNDGQNPTAALVQGTDGSFYGTTSKGGVNGFGIAFKMTISSGTANVTVLHAFGAPGSNDGETPRAALIQATDGSFYGTTSAGGANLDSNGTGYGTVFRMDASGNVTVIHSFGATVNDGQVPLAGLVQAANHSLYGVCSQGGQGGGGQVFRIRRGQGFDANNDGYSDLLSLNPATGVLTLSEMNGFNVTSQGGLGQPLASQYQLAGAGDFSGDGSADLLWRNTSSGDVSLWLLNGFNITNQNTTVFAGLPLVWQTAGVGDFNGNGMSDILWRNTKTGDVVLWEMNGLTIAQNAFVVPGLSLQWQTAGIGDFNGDGMADILWRNTKTGDVVLWEMDGPTIVNQEVVFSGLPLVWQVVGIGDFNGDGMDDILWRDTQNGVLVLWEMDGASIVSGTQIPSSYSLTWQIAGVGDFNGNGLAGVVWFNSTTGEVDLWEMNGPTILNQGKLSSSLPPKSQILAP